ncbi:RNA polymerase III RPC4-domain-containing protein [Flammula alnicola]|nr:RNA polymerase III RPC4-domain-containing protein [Flammula alnicola]
MADPSSSSSLPKAIGSLAKKQSDVTRQGTQKLKFVPTLPQRRKKEEVKAEPAAAVVPPVSQSDRGRGRGRGRGDGRGRGRGRGAAPVLEMTASGPFAMGPALAGNNARRSTPRSNFVPSVPIDGATPNFGGNLLQSAPPLLRKDLGSKGGNGKGDLVKAEDEEVYSDPDEGVEIVDMENVRQMDWMAPESLRKERQHAKKIKKEEHAEDAVSGGDADLNNALNLSESEEEEELEDIIEDFAAQSTIDLDESMREERLYFFQFPAPFPEFSSKNATAMDIDPGPEITGKKVSFAADVKQDTATSSTTPSTVPSEPNKAEPIDGVIGQLEVYKSGAVKIRLANGILLDVNAATQPSFLQQAVVVDKTQKQVVVLGEVNKQFVVSPNVDALLTALENEDNTPAPIEGEEKLIKMDPTR